MKQQEVAALREAAGVSQKEVAAAAGVSHSLVRFYERGMRIGPASEQKIVSALKAALDTQAQVVARARRRVGKAVVAVETAAA